VTSRTRLYGQKNELEPINAPFRFSAEIPYGSGYCAAGLPLKLSAVTVLVLPCSLPK